MDIVVGSNSPRCNRERFVSFYIARIQQKGASKETHLKVRVGGDSTHQPYPIFRELGCYLRAQKNNQMSSLKIRTENDSKITVYPTAVPI